TAEGVSLVTPLAGGEGTLPVVAYNVDRAFFDIFPRPLLAGRVPEEPTEVIIGPDMAELAFPGVAFADVIGQNLQLGSAGGFGVASSRGEAEVVGIYASQPVVSIGDLYDSVIVRLRDQETPIGGSLVT